jgi:hypothetical protein
MSAPTAISCQHCGGSRFRAMSFIEVVRASGVIGLLLCLTGPLWFVSIYVLSRFARVCLNCSSCSWVVGGRLVHFEPPKS